MYPPTKQRNGSRCPWLVGATLALLVAGATVRALITIRRLWQNRPDAVCAPTARGCHPRPVLPATRRISLCDSASSLNRLVVIRSAAFPQNHFRFSFPSRVTVTKPSQVRAVTRALCALPVMPPGRYYCPADFGILYHLVFSGPGLRIPPVSAEVAGCEVVNGVGAISRWMADSAHLWPTLGKAMGLTESGQKTFVGDRTGR